jgi:hypothetical protein
VYLFHPSAVDELVQVQRRPAVRTLAPLLRQPTPDAQVAAQLRAVRAQVRIPGVNVRIGDFWRFFGDFRRKNGAFFLENKCRDQVLCINYQYF